MSLSEIRRMDNFSIERPQVNRFPILSTRVSNVLNGELAGIYVSGSDRGKIRDYDEAVAGLKFLGVVVGEAYLDQDGSTYYAAVDHSGLFYKRASVTGSSASLPGAPVFATGPDPKDQLTVVSPAAGVDPVGILHKQAAASSTEWDVLFNPGRGGYGASEQFNAGKVTAYTADGAITLPVEQNEAARLTGASSAAMTLAVPTAAQIGLRFTIYRSGGTGTHDVDYTDEAGVATTRTLGTAGLAVTLLAVSTTGWRPLT